MWDDFHNQLKSHDKHKIDFNVRCVPEYPRAEERGEDVISIRNQFSLENSWYFQRCDECKN